MAGFRSTKSACNGEDLSAYIDGMLEGEAMREVAAHLRTCADCRRLYEGLSQTKTLLRTAPTPSQPPQADFWAETYRRARLEASKKSAPIALLPTRGLSGLKYRWSIAAATAGVALAAALFALSTSTAPPSKRLPTTPPAPGPVLDLSKVVAAHADYAAEQPLADDSRLSIVLSDTAQSDSPLADADSDDSTGPQGSASAGPADYSGSEAAQNAAGMLD